MGERRHLGKLRSLFPWRFGPGDDALGIPGVDRRNFGERRSDEFEVGSMAGGTVHEELVWSLRLGRRIFDEMAIELREGSCVTLGSLAYLALVCGECRFAVDVAAAPHAENNNREEETDPEIRPSD